LVVALAEEVDEERDRVEIIIMDGAGAAVVVVAAGNN